MTSPYQTFEKSHYSAPQTGHVQSDSNVSNAVPARIFCDGSPFEGLYSCPHIEQTYGSIKNQLSISVKVP
jgi:hypothetical protein